MVRKSKKAFFQELKKAGLRITRHRRAIIEIIAERQDHPNVRQVYDKMRLNNQGISLATVYNTLNMLVKMKLLKEIDFEDADNRYDTNLAPHINLICTVCGAIVDYENELPVSPDMIFKDEGFKTDKYRMEYHGICKKCQK